MKVIYPGIIKRIKRMLTGNYVEDGNTASQNIPAGKYVTWKNQLCKSTTAITTGDTLSSSNLEAVTDGGINALNSKIKRVTLSSIGNNAWAKNELSEGLVSNVILVIPYDAYGTPCASFINSSSLFEWYGSISENAVYCLTRNTAYNLAYAVAFILEG